MNCRGQNGDTFEGYVRFDARDGFGNRIEFMTPTEL